jgi:hypothetical protein
VLLVRIDADGNQLWVQYHGGYHNDLGCDIEPTGDGGFIVAGFTYSFGTGGDVYLLRTDEMGNLLWSKNFGGNGVEDVRSVVQTPDGGFVMTGWTSSSGAGGDDVYLLKTDSDGDSLWARTYGGSEDDRGYGLVMRPDGGFAIAGVTHSYGAGGGDVYVLQTDANGNLLGSVTIGGPDDEVGYSIGQMFDGCFIIGGGTESYGSGEEDVYLAKADVSGTVYWDEAYGAAGSENVYSIFESFDGGFVAAGKTESFGHGDYDVFLLRTTLEPTGIREGERIKISGIRPTLTSGPLSIEYDLTSDCPVRVAVYDVLGRCVRTITEGTQYAGPHSFTWNGRDDRGSRVTNGVYVIRVNAGESSAVRKVVLHR